MTLPLEAQRDEHQVGAWPEDDGLPPLRICLVCSDYPPGPHGGIGTMSQMLGRALHRAGHRVKVIGVYRSDYPADDRQDDQGVEVTRLRQGTGRGAWVLARVRLFKEIARWAREGAIDLVEVPDWRGWAACWPSLPVPVVARLHGSGTYFAAEMGRVADPLTRWLDRLSLRRARFICSTSRYTASRTRALIPLKHAIASVLYNPVETAEAVETGGRDRATVVFTGALVEKKGVVSLLRAWEKVTAEEPEARLHLYGKDSEGSFGPSMQAFLLGQASPAVRSTVRFHGHVTREVAQAALRRARLAVFPSYAEAFAIAPLEAMAQGCPTVYSSRGSGSEVIHHGRDGLLVDPDRPSDIAAAIVRLLRDAQLAARLGAAGRARIADQFSLEVAVRRNVAFYRHCIGASRPKSGVR